jgi:hypothetical protein
MENIGFSISVSKTIRPTLFDALLGHATDIRKYNFLKIHGI